ncbi:MAG: xanthine phosphoribosyltransferase [Erysipelotrichaceae bacterium]|nr:xanthine phosphoribosyltransferase [Erysipelotrichaceae bacterium]
MKALEEKIIQEGIVKSGDVLKVDSFLNHQIDVAFLNEIGKEFYRLFKDAGITKIVTIEASGIGVAVMTAQYFDNVKVVFAKKSKTSNIAHDVYHTHVYSYTHQINNEVMISKQYLSEDDCVLIIDDFLANGEAVKGLIDIVDQAHAKIAGIGIVIEKGYQKGGKYLRKQGYHVESLAIVEQMNDITGEITFKND